MKIKYSTLINICIIGYIIFGLALSGVSSVSKLGFVFGFLGFSLLFLYLYVEKKAIPNFFLPYTIIYIYLIFTYAWSPINNINAITGLLTVYVSSILFSFALYYELISLQRLLMLLLIPGFVSIYAYVNEINYVSVDLVPQKFYFDELVNVRFGAFIGHPNPMTSRLLLPLFVSLLYFDQLKNDKQYKLILFPIMILIALFTVYTSGSKKAVLFMALSTIPLLLIYTFVKRRVKILSIFGVLFLISLFFVIGNVDLSNTGWQALTRIDSMIQGGDASTEERMWLMNTGWKLFSESPIVGSGLDSFSYLSSAGFYSHNNILELLISGGLLAVVAYYFVVVNAANKYFEYNGIISTVFLAMLLIAFDFTGVSYSDRGTQLFICLLVSRYFFMPTARISSVRIYK